MSMDEYWDNLNEINRLCRLAKTTTSIDTLRELATSSDFMVRCHTINNSHSTEDVLLLAYAYKKFKKLKK